MKIKNYLLFVMCFVSITGFSQIKKLQELSKSNIINSQVIYEEDTEEVWGYALLYMRDKIDNKLMDLELVVLDKNLEKIGAVNFPEYYYANFLLKHYPSLRYNRKIGDKLLISVQVHSPEMIPLSERYLCFFRELNLNDFTITPSFYFSEGQKTFISSSKDYTMKTYKTMEWFSPFKKHGFIKHDLYDKYSRSLVFPTSETMSFYDCNFKKITSTKTVKSNQDQFVLDPIAISEDYLVFEKYNGGKKYTNLLKYQVEIYNVKTGDHIVTIDCKSDEYQYLPLQASLKGDQLTLIHTAHPANTNHKLSYNSHSGIVKQVYDIQQQKVIQHSPLYWADYSKKMPFNKNGKVKGQHPIHFSDFRITSDDKTIIVAEGYLTSKSTILKDLYVMELDKDFKLVNFLEIEKFHKTFMLKSYNAYELRMNRLFHYMYSQELEPDEFVFFYKDNDKKDEALSVLRSDKFTLNMITYSKGTFENQEIKLKTSEGKIYPFKAKKGYIILQEFTDTDAEIRLERINF